jgi:uncharacterized protein
MKKDYWYLGAIAILILIVFTQWASMSKRKPGPAKLSVKKPVSAAAVPIKGKIAIVLDDWGYHPKDIDLASELKAPITAAFLPNLKYSYTLSRSLHDMGFEIILHLPMEPREKLKLEKDTITSGLSEKQIKLIIDQDLSSVYAARGVSNHMGSKITTDPRIMRIVMGHFKKLGLYFLDSFVISDSVCRQISQDTGLGFAQRDVFLDNQEDIAYIRGQIEELKAVARNRGYAVGIGHDRKKTLEVLKEAIPRLKKEGYRFVYLSELVK